VVLQTSRTPFPHTWADTGSAVERVDLYCLVEVAGLAVPPRLVDEVALADFQRFVEEAGTGWLPTLCGGGWTGWLCNGG
jgi:hypothetical protein